MANDNGKQTGHVGISGMGFLIGNSAIGSGREDGKPHTDANIIEDFARSVHAGNFFSVFINGNGLVSDAVHYLGLEGGIYEQAQRKEYEYFFHVYEYLWEGEIGLNP